MESQEWCYLITDSIQFWMMLELDRCWVEQAWYILYLMYTCFSKTTENEIFGKAWFWPLPIHIVIISKQIELQTCAWSQMKHLLKGSSKLLCFLFLNEYEEETSVKNKNCLFLSLAWWRTFHHFKIEITNHQNMHP